MRINKYVANALGVSRRQADKLVSDGRVQIDGQTALLGQSIKSHNDITLDGKPLQPSQTIYLMLHKPTGYVCSRRGQGSDTIYDLLPPHLKRLPTAGRLDKDSSGLIVLTNDGDYAHQLTHPSFAKTKVYEVELDKPLNEHDRGLIEQGVELEDGVSRLEFNSGADTSWVIALKEGRNRQVRRTFKALGYKVIRLHRTQFGGYHLGGLKSGQYKEVAKL